MQLAVGGGVMIQMTWPMFKRCECKIDGVTLTLGYVSFAIVTYLLFSNPNRFVSPTELIDEIWPNPDKAPVDENNTLKVLICRLRKAGVPIESHRRWGKSNIGYRIPASERGSSPIADRVNDPVCLFIGPCERDQRKAA